MHMSISNDLSMTKGCTVCQDGCSSSQPFMVTLSPAEDEEVQFQTAYMAYTWGRVAQLGLEQHIAADRAEYWHSRLERQPCLRDLQDLRLAGQVRALCS
jgi:hypothetical protein